MQTTEVWLKKQLSNMKKCGLDPIGSLGDLSIFETQGDGRLSVGMECLDRDLWNMEPALPHIKDLGIKHARLQSGWAKTEREPGQYDFKWLDDIVNSLIEKGVSCWLSLSYGNPLYAVPGEDGRTDGLGTNPFHSPEGIEAWKKYVTATVEHFNGRIHTFEIWNEPDVSIFFPINNGGSWVEEYLHMVKETAPIIRKAAPTAKIVSVTTCGPTICGLQQIAAMLENGLGGYVDIHSFHSYKKQPEMYRRDFHDALGSGEFLNFGNQIDVGIFNDGSLEEDNFCCTAVNHFQCGFGRYLVDIAFDCDIISTRDSIDTVDIVQL